MGRLFWKFFFFILLAQVTAIVGISGTLWLKHKAEDSFEKSSDRQTNAALVMESAEMALQQGGPHALGRLEGTLRHFQIYVIDAHNRDVFGRLVSLASIEKFKASSQVGNANPLVRVVVASDKQSYLVFFSAMEDAWDRTDPNQMPGEPIPPTGQGMRGDGLPLGMGERPPPGPEFGPGPGPMHGQPHGVPPDRGFYPLVPLFFSLIVSLLFAALLAWYMSKPIRSLRSAFIALAGGKLDTRISASMGKRRDELADLGREFDAMAETLYVLMQSQKQLMHDVSHELRSPLARLQVAIGLARQQPDRLEESLDRLENESVRMDKLVGELLTLSRIEAGVIDANEEISLPELMAELVENGSFEAEAKQRQLVYGGDTDVLIMGKYELLYRALENVVRNAIKHTPEGSSISLSTAMDVNGRAKISVCDEGSGVLESELPAIFDPFYRGSQSGAQHGYGLGLTIARRVVQAHGGSIGAHNHSGGGLCVEIILPCLPAQAVV